MNGFRDLLSCNVGSTLNNHKEDHPVFGLNGLFLCLFFSS